VSSCIFSLNGQEPFTSVLYSKDKLTVFRYSVTRNLINKGAEMNRFAEVIRKTLLFILFATAALTSYSVISMWGEVPGERGHWFWWVLSILVASLILRKFINWLFR
jgi:hypothetical protein